MKEVCGLCLGNGVRLVAWPPGSPEVMKRCCDCTGNGVRQVPGKKLSVRNEAGEWIEVAGLKQLSSPEAPAPTATADIYHCKHKEDNTKEPHECPYAGEIHGNRRKECTCCERCESSCMDYI